MQKNIPIILTILLLTIPLIATTLPELIESGLQHNSVIKKTNLQIELMKAKKEESQAKQFGSVDVVGSYTHYNVPRTLAPIVPSSLSSGASIDTTQDLFSTGVQYSVPLFTGGALEQQVNIDKLSQSVGESKKRLSREELIYNIRSLYLSALSLQEVGTSQEAYVLALTKLRDMIAYELKLGRKAKIELLKADNNLQEAKGEVAVTLSSLQMVKLTLESLTYSKKIGHLEPLDVTIDTPNTSIDLENLDALERFKLQDLEIKKGAKMVSKVEALQKPQVGLNSYMGYNYDIDQRDPLEKEQLWQIAVNVTWNAFDFGATSARVQQAKIAKLQAIVEKEATTEGFKKLFSKARGEISTAFANHQSNQSQYHLLAESEKIEEARYNAGVATLNDLLLAKSKTQLAKSKMIQSRYAYQNGVYYLDYLLERGER
ncbi:TolC family protein [bacterium]|nr:TolC family protein [bacterium]MBU1958200.1 TolC family protein [bacterium]